MQLPATCLFLVTSPPRHAVAGRGNQLAETRRHNSGFCTLVTGYFLLNTSLTIGLTLFMGIAKPTPVNMPVGA